MRIPVIIQIETESGCKLREGERGVFRKVP